MLWCEDTEPERVCPRWLLVVKEGEASVVDVRLASRLSAIGVAWDARQGTRRRTLSVGCASWSARTNA